MNRYPPLNALSVFLHASRTMSFSKAADELCVTRSAVSRQIKNLEEHLDVKLFRRHKKGLDLTEEGVKYANALALIFAELKVATDAITGRTADNLKLRLSLSATFNSNWLLSRLKHLEELYPDLALAFITNNYDTGTEPVDFENEPMDAAIRLGTGSWEHCHADKLMDIYVQPVCAPALIGDAPLSEAHGLSQYNWLHYKHLPDLWQQWAASTGAPELRSEKEDIVFDNVWIATQAAVDGLGILPIYRPLADSMIAEGKVVPAHRHIMQRDKSYYFLAPADYENRKPVKWFRDWIINESQAFNKRWMDKVLTGQRV